MAESRPTHEQADAALSRVADDVTCSDALHRLLAAEVRALRAELDRMHSALQCESHAHVAERDRLRAALAAAHEVVRVGQRVEHGQLQKIEAAEAEAEWHRRATWAARGQCDATVAGVVAVIAEAGLGPVECPDEDPHLPTMVREALAAARSAQGCEMRTEWSVRGPQGNVWQLYPASEAHARQRLRLEGRGELVTREVRSTTGPWTAVPQPAEEAR